MKKNEEYEKLKENETYSEEIRVMPREDGPYCEHYNSNIPNGRLRRLLNKETVKVAKNLCKKLNEDMTVKITIEKMY